MFGKKRILGPILRARFWVHFSAPLLGPFILIFLQRVQFPGPFFGPLFGAQKIEQFWFPKLFIFGPVRRVLCGNGGTHLGQAEHRGSLCY